MADREDKQTSKESQQQRRSKKVGFASNLTSFENQSPGSERHVWDSETDHMLSYFLGGDSQFNFGIPEFSSADPLDTRITPGSEGHDGMLAGMYLAQGSYHNSDEQQGDVGLPLQGANSEEDEEEDEEPMAPPTPKAPQFYARPAVLVTVNAPTARPHSASPSAPFRGSGGGIASASFGSTGGTMNALDLQGPQSAVPSSGSSSSSSLSTMANTLVSGGPMLLHQMQQHQQMYASMMAMAQQQSQHQQYMQAQSASPVSPAAMIGTPENLMLPAAPIPGQQPFPHMQQQQQHLGMMGPVYQNVAVQSASSGSSQGPMLQQTSHPALSPSSQQRHIQWLQSLNAMAKAGQGPQEHTQQHQQQTTAPSPQQTMPPPQMHPAAQYGIPFSVFPHMTFYGHAAAAAAAAMQQTKNPSPEESEEKRAKRLERNRESARKSRRRKKERLAAVESQVEKMHQRIALERERQIQKLIPGLRKCRMQQLTKFHQEESPTTPAAVMTMVRETGPNSPIFQAVLEYQFNYLQALLFPRYQKFWLWLALNNESYFSAGKEEYIKRDPDRLIIRTSTGKISSKQVGDELVNGPLVDSKRPASPRGGSNSSVGGADDPTRTCHADDASHMWPLVCYEHQFSVDQEEKLITLHKKIGQKHDIQASWRKSQAAVRACASLRDAMEFVSKASSNREERTLVGVLRVDQILKYREWIVMNHKRCTRSLQNQQICQQHHQQQSLQSSSQRQSEPGGTADQATKPTTLSTATQASSESLQDICLRLERVLKVSKNEKHH